MKHSETGRTANRKPARVLDHRVIRSTCRESIYIDVSHLTKRLNKVECIKKWIPGVGDSKIGGTIGFWDPGPIKGKPGAFFLKRFETELGGIYVG